MIIVWCITVLATISTVSGIGLGIRRLSEFCFCLGLVLLLSVFFLDNTWFILNLFCQSIGYYFQWIMQLGWHTDAFEQLGKSDGGQDRLVVAGVGVVKVVVKLVVEMAVVVEVMVVVVV